MYELEKCPKHSGTTTAAPLERTYVVVAVSQKYKKFRIGRLLYRSYILTCIFTDCSFTKHCLFIIKHYLHLVEMFV